jgi:hypothetical protein
MLWCLYVKAIGVIWLYIMGYELYGDIGFRFKVLKFWFQSFVFKFWVRISGLGFKFSFKSF